ARCGCPIRHLTWCKARCDSSVYRVSSSKELTVRHDLALVLLIFGLLGQVALLGANLFEAVVDVPNWRTSAGLSAYRRFITQRNAGHFYRGLSPLTIVCLGMALGLGWGAHGPRNGLLTVSLAAAITA